MVELIPIDEDAPELTPRGNGGGGQMVPTETKIGDVVSMRRAAMLMPRQPSEVRRLIAEAAEMFGDTWDYRFPVKSKGETSWIEGPTIGCTMAVARAYGNCDVAHTRTEDEGNSWILYSTFVDLQSGFSLTRGFRQRKGQSTMGGDRARGEDIAFQIGVSKSTRNVVARALDDFVQYARQRARDRLSGSIAKRPDEYRERIKEYLGEAGYRLAAVEGAVGAKLAAWTPEQIAQVVRTLIAHKDGVLRDLDDVYAPKGADAVEAKPQEHEEISVKAEMGGADQYLGGTHGLAESPARAPEPEPATTPPIATGPAEPPKPRRGRPTNEEIAQRIMVRVVAVHPNDVGAVLRENAAAIERLPEHLRTEILTAAQGRQAEGDDEGELGDAGPLPAEPQPTEEPDDFPGDSYDDWLRDMYAAFAAARPEFRVAVKNRWAAEAKRFGDHAVKAVQEAYEGQG
jgi:hypothetical protein